jgi:predicted dehydrogenase
MEKPPAMRVAGVEEMIAARGDRVCAVSFKKAYMPATRKAHELIASPEFGPLRSIFAVYPMTIPHNGREILDSGHYCNWLVNGCHPLSLMIALGGRVEAMCTSDEPLVAVISFSAPDRKAENLEGGETT